MNLVFGNKRPQEIPAQDHAAAPNASACYVVCQISAIRHSGCPGHGWAKCSNDGHEPRQDNRLASILFIKLLRSFQVPALEKPGLLPAVKRTSCLTPNPI